MRKTTETKREPDPLRLLSLQKIRANGGPSPDALKRAAKRGEIQIIRLSANRSAVRETEWERYLAARTKVA
jgi:hypothetical protein